MKQSKTKTLSNRYSNKGYHEGSRQGEITLIICTIAVIAGAIGMFCIMFGVGI